ISGFATDRKSGGSGTIIAGLKPQLVLQPWTEDPDAAEDATHATADSQRSPKGFIAGLAAMNRLAERVTQIAVSGHVSLSPAARKRLAFVGADNVKNKSAVENLIAMGKRKGAKPVYAHHGSDSGLE